MDLFILKTNGEKFTSTNKKTLHLIFKWYSYHASTNWMLLNTDTDANMQLTIYSFWPLFPDNISPDTSPTYSNITASCQNP